MDKLQVITLICLGISTGLLARAEKEVEFSTEKLQLKDIPNEQRRKEDLVPDGTEHQAELSKVKVRPRPVKKANVKINEPKLPSKHELVTNGNAKHELVTNGNAKHELVTNGNAKHELVTTGNAEVAKLQTESTSTTSPKIAERKTTQKPQKTATFRKIIRPISRKSNNTTEEKVSTEKTEPKTASSTTTRPKKFSPTRKTSKSTERITTSTAPTEVKEPVAVTKPGKAFSRRIAKPKDGSVAGPQETTSAGRQKTSRNTNKETTKKPKSSRRTRPKQKKTNEALNVATEVPEPVKEIKRCKTTEVVRESLIGDGSESVIRENVCGNE